MSELNRIDLKVTFNQKTIENAFLKASRIS